MPSFLHVKPSCIPPPQLTGRSRLRGRITCEYLSFLETLERREARERYFRNFSVKVIQGPYRERTFALDRFYQVLALHLEDTEFIKTHVLLEDDNHSLQWVPSNEVTVNIVE